MFSSFIHSFNSFMSFIQSIHSFIHSVIQFNSTQLNSMHCNAMQCNAMQSKTRIMNNVLSCLAVLIQVYLLRVSSSSNLCHLFIEPSLGYCIRKDRKLRSTKNVLLEEPADADTLANSLQTAYVAHRAVKIVHMGTLVLLVKQQVRT